MLVLSRKVGESIMIGDDIKITIIKQDGWNIKVGVDAPRELPVHREEVYQRIQEEKSGRLLGGWPGKDKTETET